MNPRVTRLARLAVAAVMVVGTVAGLAVRPRAQVPTARVDYVLVAGAAGLRWDDLSPSATPALWHLAGEGAIGALAVRSAREVTCPADGWLTLGAGNLARRNPASAPASAPNTCPATEVEVKRPDARGAFLTDQPAVVRANEKLSWGTRPGALAESVRCTVAVGPGAAIAAARPIGRVDRYVATLPDDPTGLLASCVLTIVDLGDVAGTGVARAEAVSRVDAAAARMLAARPDDSLVLVAGLADTDQISRLHVAIAQGPGYEGGWLASPSTKRARYLQLFDLAPTAVAALGRPRSTELFAGTVADQLPGRPEDLLEAVSVLTDDDLEAATQRRVSTRFLLALVIGQLVLLAAAVPLLRRARRGRGGSGSGRGQANGQARAGPRMLIQAALIAAGLAAPAALALQAVPWWRAPAPGWVFLAGWLALAGLGTLLVFVPWLRRHTLGPPAAAAGLAALVVLVDIGLGGRLQLNGVAGYSALDGGRYAGIGSVGLGVLSAGVLMLAGCVGPYLPRAWRTLLIAGPGGLAVVMVGNPAVGADAAGAIAVTVGVCVSAVVAGGAWLTVRRIAAVAGIGAAVTAAVAVVELGRPVDDRGSLGRILTATWDGSALTLVERATAANVTASLQSPLAVLALAGAGFVFFVLWQHWGGLKRLFGIYPTVRATAVGLALAALLGGLLNGVGLAVAGAAASVAVPLLTAASLRALAHADERTQVARRHTPSAEELEDAAFGQRALVLPARAQGRPGSDRPDPDRPDPGPDRPGPDLEPELGAGAVVGPGGGRGGGDGGHGGP